MVGKKPPLSSDIKLDGGPINKYGSFRNSIKSKYTDFDLGSKEYFFNVKEKGSINYSDGLMSLNFDASYICWERVRSIC